MQSSWQQSTVNLPRGYLPCGRCREAQGHAAGGFRVHGIASGPSTWSKRLETAIDTRGACLVAVRVDYSCCRTGRRIKLCCGWRRGWLGQPAPFIRDAPGFGEANTSEFSPRWGRLGRLPDKDPSETIRVCETGQTTSLFENSGHAPRTPIQVPSEASGEGELL
jgi:hypothetical protein